MNNQLILLWLFEAAEKLAEEYYSYHEDGNLNKDFFGINRPKNVELPSLPKSNSEMVLFLREHFKDDVNSISLILNHFFPESFIFYRFQSLKMKSSKVLNF